MTTLGDLTGSIASSLHSYTGIQEQSTYLTASVTEGDLALPVASSDTILRGIAELDDELVYVETSDASGLVLPPFGRGYRGSTATTHAANTQVTFDPVFPRVEIIRAINQTVAGLYPQLFQVKSTDLTYTPVPIGFDLPADVEGVLGVKAKLPGDPTNMWVPVLNWSFDQTSPEATGKSLNLFDTLPSGSTVRVDYRTRFDTFTATTESFADVGLEESYADLILYGVTARMVRFLDPARLQVRSVENLSRAAVVQAGEAGKIANQLYAMFTQRLTEERQKLLELYPPTIHFQR